MSHLTISFQVLGLALLIASVLATIIVLFALAASKMYDRRIEAQDEDTQFFKMIERFQDDFTH